MNNDKRPLRLLLVDDDEGNRLTLEALLEDEGFEVDVASSVEGARATLEERAEGYFAVLLDYHLDDRQATELLPTVKERHPAARVVFLSGTGFAEPIEGADACLLKGQGFDDVVAAINGTSGGQPA